MSNVAMALDVVPSKDPLIFLKTINIGIGNHGIVPSFFCGNKTVVSYQ
jgi:hypothetical protein